MRPDPFLNLPSHPMDRVQRSHGLLKDEPDFGPPDLAQSRLGRPNQLLAEERWVLVRGSLTADSASA